ncbi:hypothetical protein MW887_004888 [Aspergillus wentii]|nr:hypothetical protein MW887_004888 [Aspergillus wentii]
MDDYFSTPFPSPNPPVSPASFHREDFPSPLFSRRSQDVRYSLYSPVSPRTESVFSRHESYQPILRSNIPWEPTDDSNCWSDAVTASAVLGLLRKDPVQPPQNRTSELNRIVESNDEPREEQREEQQQQEERQQGQLFTCASCFESLDHRSYPQTPITAGCDHSGTPTMHICISCLRHSLDMQFSSDSESLMCPLCHTHLSPDDVQRWASAETFQVYDTIRTRQILERDSEFVTCARMNCGAGQLHVGGREDPVVVCRACGTWTCFNHRDTIYHEGMTCEEYDVMAKPRFHRIDSPGNTRRSPGLLQRIRGLKTAKNPSSQPYRLDATKEELLSWKKIGEIARPCPRCNTGYFSSHSFPVEHLQTPTAQPMTAQNPAPLPTEFSANARVEWTVTSPGPSELLIGREALGQR